MDKLSLKERYENLLYAFNFFGTFILDKDDEEIGWLVFEDFIDYAIVDFYIDNLKDFLDNKMIDEKTYKACLELREKYLSYESDDSDIRSVYDVKTNPKWKELLELADSIKAMLKNSEGSLDNSVLIKPSSPRRLGYSEGKIVVLDRIEIKIVDGRKISVYQGHIRTYDQLNSEMKLIARKLFGVGL